MLSVILGHCHSYSQDPAYPSFLTWTKMSVGNVALDALSRSDMSQDQWPLPFLASAFEEQSSPLCTTHTQAPVHCPLFCTLSKLGAAAHASFPEWKECRKSACSRGTQTNPLSSEFIISEATHTQTHTHGSSTRYVPAACTIGSSIREAGEGAQNEFTLEWQR